LRNRKPKLGCFQNVSLAEMFACFNQISGLLLANPWISKLGANVTGLNQRFNGVE
jgi:hypothetical protein